jgi:hypothetical protein
MVQLRDEGAAVNALTAAAKAAADAGGIFLPT